MAGFSRNGASPLLSAFVVAVFTSITVVFFDADYTGLRERSIKSQSVMLPLLVTLMAIALFYRVGIIVSVLIGYFGVYLAFLFYFESKKIPDAKYRRYYYLLKLPYPLLAPLALVGSWFFSISGASHNLALPPNVPLAKNRTASEKYSPQNKVRCEHGE